MDVMNLPTQIGAVGIQNDPGFDPTRNPEPEQSSLKAPIGKTEDDMVLSSIGPCVDRKCCSRPMDKVEDLERSILIEIWGALFSIHFPSSLMRKIKRSNFFSQSICQSPIPGGYLPASIR